MSAIATSALKVAMSPSSHHGALYDQRTREGSGRSRLFLRIHLANTSASPPLICSSKRAAMSRKRTPQEFARRPRRATSCLSHKRLKRGQSLSRSGGKGERMRIRSNTCETVATMSGCLPTITSLPEVNQVERPHSRETIGERSFLCQTQPLAH